MDIKKLEDIQKYLIQLDDKVSVLRSEISVIQDLRNKYIKCNRNIIKESWPDTRKWYQLTQKAIKELCWHYDLQYSRGTKFIKCICKEEIIFFKVKTQFKYGSDEKTSDYFTLELEGDLYDQFYNKLNDQEMVSVEFNQIIESNIAPIKNKLNKIKLPENKTFIYLMFDNNNNYYKIGRSNNPKYRESTLQSEKPSIDLLFYWKDEPHVEKMLHYLHSNKRIRGEWFALNSNDVNNLIAEYRTKDSFKIVKLIA